MSCCAVFCKSRTTIRGLKNPEISFHMFPKCPEIRNQWIKAVRRENWEPNKYSRLCSKHFAKSSYVAGLAVRKLKSDAIPVIFEGYPSYYQPSVAKKRKQKNENLELTPRQRKRIEDSGVTTEDLPITPQQAMNVLISLSKARTAASRRLRIIKRLRESKLRLLKKNAKLLNIINDLKSRARLQNRLLDTESLEVLSSISEKNKDVLGFIITVE